MANISLTKCNIIENNCCGDNEILYPLTVTDQVILDNGKTLTEWIEQLNLNSSISVESYYEYPIAKVGNTEIGIPVWDGVNQVGIVLPHSDYFGLEGGQMKPKRTYSPAFDSSITIGTVQGDNGASLYDVKMPSFNLDTLVDGSTVTLQLKAGNTIFSSNSFSVTSTTPILEYDNGRLRIYDAPGNYDQTVYIPTSEYIAGDNISINSNIISATYTAGNNIEITNGVISATSNVYTAGDNITIDDLGEISAVYPTYIAGDNITIDGYTISASYPVYTAGNGINIDDNGVISTTGSGSTSTFTPVIDEIYITSGVATSQTGTNNMQTIIGNLDQVGYDCIEQEKDFKIFANFTDYTTANNDLLYAFNLVNNIQKLLTNNLKAHHKIELYINTIDLASITFSRLVIPQKTKMIGQVGSDRGNCFNVDYNNSTVEFNLTKERSAKIEFNYINTSNWFIWAYFLQPANAILSS